MLLIFKQISFYYIELTLNLSINIAKSEEKESFVFHPSELRTKVLYFSIEGLRSSISRPLVEEVYDLLIMSLYGSCHSAESKESRFVYFIVSSCKSG